MSANVAAHRTLLALVCLSAFAACSAPESEVENPAVSQTNNTPGADGKSDSAREAFSDGPLYMTGAFDGSKRFGMWIDTVDFTRRIEREYGKKIRFTYFINTCYYDTEVVGSVIGKAHSREEVLARIALTQQAINEGHEIGNHSVRHKDGSRWSAEQWREEFREFHEVVDNTLFQPIFDPLTGEQVFPKWPDNRDVAPGTSGAACSSDDACSSGTCVIVAPEQGYCTQRCNGNRPCPDGMACGAPDWNSSTDVCVPVPEFPVEYQGQVLFDEEGNPNLEHPALRPYPMIGFRAPQLAHNAALFEVLTEFGYVYDTSKVLAPGPPQRVQHGGTTWENLYEFALMRNPGAATIPMDYNYYAGEISGERMLEDYKKSVLDAYHARNRQPWNIGHHFALWQRGAYWQAMQDVFEWAAQGCPGADGTRRCEETDFPSFAELVGVLDSLSSSKADDGESDIFAEVSNEEQAVETYQCMCGEGVEDDE